MGNPNLPWGGKKKKKKKIREIGKKGSPLCRKATNKKNVWSFVEKKKSGVSPPKKKQRNHSPDVLCWRNQRLERGGSRQEGRNRKAERVKKPRRNVFRDKKKKQGSLGELMPWWKTVIVRRGEVGPKGKKKGRFLLSEKETAETGLGNIKRKEKGNLATWSNILVARD